MARYILTRRVLVSVGVIVAGFAAMIAVAVQLVGDAPTQRSLVLYLAGWLIIPYFFGALVGLMSLMVLKRGRRAACIFGSVAVALLAIVTLLGVRPSQFPTVADSGNAADIFSAALTMIFFVPSISATIAGVAAAFWQSIKRHHSACDACGCDLGESDSGFCPKCGSALLVG